MHHSGKPSADPKSRRGWTQTDYSYFGLGSSILTNWVRATCTMLKRDDNLYELQFGKRGRRAGALDMVGQRSTSIFLQHSPETIFWQQIASPESSPTTDSKTRGRPAATLAVDAFLDHIRGEHLGYIQCLDRIQLLVDCGERVAKSIFAGLRESLLYDPDFKTYSSP